MQTVPSGPALPAESHHDDGLAPIVRTFTVVVSLLPVRLRPAPTIKVRKALIVALRNGWTDETFRDRLMSDRWGADVESPGAVVDAICRLCHEMPPEPTGRATWPAWCGQCDERTRRVAQPDGLPSLRCPTCSPLPALHALGVAQ